MNRSLHIFNARIWTGDPQRPRAKSVTIKNGRIVAMDEALDKAGTGLTMIDGHGRTVTPGLIDSHLHMLRGGESLSRLDLSHVKSRGEFERAIRQRHEELSPNEWLIAFGWSQENWGGEMPAKDWLHAAGDRPTVCYRMDMHVAVVNEAVLGRCDLSQPIVGGEVGRDERGAPNGLMIEAAAWQLINPIIPKPDAKQRQQHLCAAMRFLNSFGVTGAGSMEYQRDVEEVFEPLRNELTVRTHITLLDQRDVADASEFDFSFGRDFSNDVRLAVIGYKAFIDGTLGSRTARMLQDYADDPGNRGMLVELAERGLLHEWACRVAAAGLSPSMHAIGDEAAQLALNAIDAAGENCRARIEHAQQLDLADIPRFGGRIASMQPLHKADDCRYVERRLGGNHLSGTFAFRKLLNVGAILAFGSDWPVVSPDPVLGMRTAVAGVLMDGTRFGEKENLTVEEALIAYTSAAAFSLQMNDAGMLKVGSLGDVVMFDRDPITADWINRPPKVGMTIMGGDIVFDAEII